MTETLPPKDLVCAGKSVSARLVAALLAGSIAIGVNTALLVTADAAGLVTARGGLLRLLLNTGGHVAAFLNLTSTWNTMLVPAATSTFFQTAFHVIVGLLMAVFYAFVVERALSGPTWAKGLIYAIAVWLLNAFLVLPLIGEGIAGSRRLDLFGMVGFAVIHTVFFVLLAVLFAHRMAKRHRCAPNGAS